MCTHDAAVFPKAVKIHTRAFDNSEEQRCGNSRVRSSRGRVLPSPRGCRAVPSAPVWSHPRSPCSVGHKSEDTHPGGPQPQNRSLTAPVGLGAPHPGKGPTREDAAQREAPEQTELVFPCELKRRHGHVSKSAREIPLAARGSHAQADSEAVGAGAQHATPPVPPCAGCCRPRGRAVRRAQRRRPLAEQEPGGCAGRRRAAGLRNPQSLPHGASSAKPGSFGPTCGTARTGSTAAPATAEPGVGLSHSCTRSHTRSHTPAHTQSAHALTHAHLHTPMAAHTYPHLRAQAHPHTRGHLHTRTPAHVHTHVRPAGCALPAETLLTDREERPFLQHRVRSQSH